MQSKKNEIWVGAFVLIALAAIIFLCLKVADIRSFGSQPTYRVYASFSNIGSLKVRSPVKVGGVVIGRVGKIWLDHKNYAPQVELDIFTQYDNIPNTSSLSIRTSGLLGEQYLALNIGFTDEDLGTFMLKDGDRIETTHSAMVLEDLIGQFLYKSGGGKEDKSASAPGQAH
ncbi:virulence factor Mce family protein [Xenorhabdus mauleonii]|uniref:Phospholipid/cholesterol/gamma-HCH transport system substrate-binding protein n=1 Tax=Xenorhabdus mauleonii TaxID=351675 RepID=A0A1I3TFJ7_9GAMM|nr:outer membrane lipid asymmetry maintenance protein MlaD [Xenorhabdus mauleonii]PHM39754.1 virulence factor Mce family protein [Xenorhabdus mauleonii]SFJ69948.1 phospholipid/cholesterol/gamma-HCH transport system substrate-binding protein [Xenorhabdus mauleonii]